jgi:hypothetical protein
MEILHNYEFKRESRSRYAAAIKALVEDGVFSVRLFRGVDFPKEVPMNSIQGGVKDAFKKSGHHIRTFTEGEDAIVISRQPEGYTPRGRKKRQRAEAPSAA